jgi:hypothetical protein
MKQLEKFFASPIAIYAMGGLILFLILKRIGLVPEQKSADEKRAEKEMQKIVKEIKDSKVIWSTDFWEQYPAKAYTAQQAKNLAAHIRDSFGVFNDDEARIFGVFRQIKYQTNVSQISYAYSLSYGRDLHSDLRDYLSEKEMAEVYQIISSKPL